MKIIFMGSSAFAVTSLEALLKSSHELQLVVCQPDKPSGRGLKVHSCPVAEFCHHHNLKPFQPKTLRSSDVKKHLAELKPDLIVVVAYGKYLPSEVLNIPTYGCINVHASLLPKYRGAAPINWAIVNGDESTGVTTMMINEEMDAGDILLQKETKIDPEESAPQLIERLAVMGATLLLETIIEIEKGTAKPKPQDKKQVSFAPLIKKEDGLINWQRSSKEIYNFVRGMQPWPCAHTHWNDKMLKIFKARAADEDHQKPAGTIIKAHPDIAVATGQGTIYPLEVQIEGKKRMPIDSFLRGHKIEIGEVLK